MEDLDNVLFTNTITVNSLDFDKIELYIKFPQSTRRQKVSFVASDIEVVRTKEKFASIFKYTLLPSMFTNMSVELNTTIHINALNFDFPFSDTKFPLDESFFEDRAHLLEFLLHDQSNLTSNIHTKFISEKITESCFSLHEAVKSVLEWINLVLFYDYDRSSPYKKIEDILLSHKGTCADFVHLSLMLLRELNIPSRAVQGLVKINNTWKTHSWLEYYDPIYLWLPFDVTLKPPLFGLNENYIKLFTSEDCFVPYYVVKINGQGNFDKSQIHIENSLFIDRTTVNLSKMAPISE